jgi:hypothetical protein
MVSLTLLTLIYKVSQIQKKTRGLTFEANVALCDNYSLWESQMKLFIPWDNST